MLISKLQRKKHRQKMWVKNSNNIIAIILVIVNISSHGVTSHNDEQESSAHTNSTLTAKSRVKRALIFQPGSRILVSGTWWHLNGGKSASFSHKIPRIINQHSDLFTQLCCFSLPLLLHPNSQFRINVKDDIIRNNTIFSHGWGFRANIDLLQPYRPPKPKARQIRRRDVYGTIEELINQHGGLHA